jgi:LPXTG-site transpeptidase (sortase) family protein
MTNEQARKMLKIALAIYLASFLIINWNDISWMFNYREVYGIFYDFFNPYPSIDSASMNAYFYPNHSQPGQTGQSPAVVQAVAKEPKTNSTNKQNTLEVPKISIEVPIVFSSSAEKTLLTKDLDKGVVYYPGSVYPGQNGQIIILGHSAPPNWPKIKHDWVFTDLNELEIGDVIYIDLNGKQYTYIVKQKKIINRGADVPVLAESADNNVLTLISCWPPGKDYQRIAVQAVLQYGGK